MNSKWPERVLLFAAVVALGLVSNVASAQFEYHGPENQVGYTACLEMLDGSYWCDGAGFVYLPPSCNLQRCMQSCYSSYAAAVKRCDGMTDSPQRANCIFIAEENLRFCWENCERWGGCWPW
ncbi:MAG TPA: hypothetical protein PLB02_05740 [Thermoanaerobaculia bacterium]|nr:hypothetical protein [Thermoanaerobaculia bacterium]HQR66878.1 hypothetical protein [Thermoanaerobaculia bacterium]